MALKRQRRRRRRWWHNERITTIQQKHFFVCTHQVEPLPCRLLRSTIITIKEPWIAHLIAYSLLIPSQSCVFFSSSSPFFFIRIEEVTMEPIYFSQMNKLFPWLYFLDVRRNSFGWMEHFFLVVFLLLFFFSYCLLVKMMLFCL